MAAALHNGEAAHLQQAIRIAVRAIAAVDPRLTSMDLVRTGLSLFGTAVWESHTSKQLDARAV